MAKKTKTKTNPIITPSPGPNPSPIIPIANLSTSQRSQLQKLLNQTQVGQQALFKHQQAQQAKTAKKPQFWRTDDPVMDQTTNAILRGGMWPGQREWWYLPNFIKILVGGYGAGKTHILSKRLIYLALLNAPVPVAGVSPTFSMARKTLVITIRELLDGKQTIFGRSLEWQFNKSTWEFVIKFRGRIATILILSGEDPQRLKGPNLGAAGIDEPFIQHQDVFDQMVARVRHPYAKQKELCLTGTPETLNWGYDLCIGEMSECNDVGYVQVSTKENRALDTGYIGRLEGALDAKAFKAYVEGHFVNLAEGMVYYDFDPSRHVVSLDMPKGAELGAGMDFNVNPMSAVVFWRMGDHLHFIDEVELPNADTEYMCDIIREKYPDLDEVYPDATGSARKTSAPGGKSDFWYIKQAGLHVRAHNENPKRRDRYNAVNARFKPTKGDPKLTVDPRCKKLIRYFQTYSHELMNKDDQKAMSHLLDAATYPVSFLFPVSKDQLQSRKLKGF